jgi:hypothetical protein
VHAKIPRGPAVQRIDRQRLFRERRGLVESVMAGGMLAGEAVDLPVRRIDLEDRRDLAVERRLVVLDVGHGRQRRVRVEVCRIDGQDFVDLRARLLVPIVVEVQAGEQQMGIGEVRIDRERLGRGGRGLRRILVLEHARDPGVRRRPLRVGLERGLERLHRLGAVVFFEKEAAPGGLDDRRSRAGALRVAIERVGVARAVERMGGAPGAIEHVRVRRRLPLAMDRRQQRLGVAGAPDHAKQERQLQRGLAAGVPRRDRLEQRLGFLVLPAADRQLREHDRRRRIRRPARGRQLRRLVTLAVRQRRRRRARKIRRRGRRLPGPHGRAGDAETGEQRDNHQQSC